MAIIINVFLLVFFASVNLLSMNSTICSQNAYPDKRVITVGTHGCLNMPKVIHSFDEFFHYSMMNNEGRRVYLVDLDFTLVRPFYPLVYFSAEKQEEILIEACENDPRLANVDFKTMQHFADHLGLSQAQELLDEMRKEILVDQGVIDFMKAESKKGAIFIALTARPIATADETERRLERFGINFPLLSGLGSYEQVFSHKAGIRGGIYYTGELGQKALGIVHIINIITQVFRIPGPLFVSVVDDNPDEINAIEEYSFGLEDFSESVFITPFLKPFNYHDALISEFYVHWSATIGQHGTTHVSSKLHTNNI